MSPQHGLFGWLTGKEEGTTHRLQFSDRKGVSRETLPVKVNSELPCNVATKGLQ